MKPPTGTTVHLCPPKGSNVCPCCGRTPFELPRSDRITAHVELGTCGGRVVAEVHEPPGR